MAPEPLRRRQQQQQQQRPDPPPPPPSPSPRGFGSGDLERRSHMAFDELHRRQRDIARLRARGAGGGGTGATGRGKGGRTFGLLLPRIAAPPSSSAGGGGGGRGGFRGRCAALCLASIPLALWLLRSTGRGGGEGGSGGSGSVLTKADRASVRHKYWKGDVEEHTGDGRSDGVEDRGQVLLELSKSSRPFKFLGDLDPREAKPWSEDEKDWWSLHETLAKDVKASDAAPPSEFDVDASRLPQLVFYGDSIAEGWRGTSFGNPPGKHRMWTKGEDEDIRRVFLDAFGERSEWGKRALKPPLVLGISGSNTRDFLWRVRNGEFPTSRLLDDDNDDAEAKGKKEAKAEKEDEDEAEDEDEHSGGKEEPMDDFVATTFQLERLERIYVVLIGTNNLGGGMLPGPTVEGMDAAGRALLELHRTTFPGVPSAMLFSGLLPRRDDFRARRMCPPRCKNETTSEPYRSFLPAIEKVNRALPEVVDGWRKDFENARIVLLSGSPEEEEGKAKGEGDDDPIVAEGKELEEDYVETVRCGRDMFAAENADEFDVLMPDRLHPNARGYEVWSRCIKRGLEAVMEGSVKLVEKEEES